MQKATPKQLESMTEAEFKQYIEKRIQSACPRAGMCGPCQYGSHNKNIKTWPCHHKCEEHKRLNN